MKECDNNKIHISSNFLLSICLIILDTLLLGPSLHCKHFATFHHTSPNYTSLHLSTLHFLFFTLHYPLIWLNPFTFPTSLFPPHPTKLDTVHFCRLQAYFQNNEPLYYPKGNPHHFTSLNFTFYLYLFIYLFICKRDSLYQLYPLQLF
jgi:hypothetical protein